MTAKDPRADVLAKAVKDPAFRKELLADPAAAIEKATGVKVPAGMNVKVIEDSASVVHLVLPADPKALNESDLKKVSGGYGAGFTKPGGCMDSNTGGWFGCNKAG
jgi:hypothetical protein